MNYEPLIERDLDAIPDAAHAFLESHAPEELWVSVTRFAVLAYAPSQHAKRAVMACRAAYEIREEMGESWPELLIECARYASQSRQPWSEPPILDPPEPSSEDLRDAIADGDRLRAERWLSAHLEDAETLLREVARGDALLMLDTALALLPHLGEKGRFALLRMPLSELVADPDARDEDVPLETLIARAVEGGGTPELVLPVFVALVEPQKSILSEAKNQWSPLEDGALVGARGFGPREGSIDPSLRSGLDYTSFRPYPLARDYAQTLLAHYYAADIPPLLDAVRRNLEQGENFSEWSFA